MPNSSLREEFYEHFKTAHKLGKDVIVPPYVAHKIVEFSADYWLPIVSQASQEGYERGVKESLEKIERRYLKAKKESLPTSIQRAGRHGGFLLGLLTAKEQLLIPSPNSNQDEN